MSMWACARVSAGRSPKIRISQREAALNILWTAKLVRTMKKGVALTRLMGRTCRALSMPKTASSVSLQFLWTWNGNCSSSRNACPVNHVKSCALLIPGARGQDVCVSTAQPVRCSQQVPGREWLCQLRPRLPEPSFLSLLVINVFQNRPATEFSHDAVCLMLESQNWDRCILTLEVFHILSASCNAEQCRNQVPFMGTSWKTCKPRPCDWRQAPWHASGTLHKPSEEFLAGTRTCFWPRKDQISILTS